jgi:hypothetical protein
MGVISIEVVVTGLERRNRQKAVQPGNQEWVIVIHSISAQGEAIPPFIIFAGTYYLSMWYTDNNIPHDWAISLSKNGWTTVTDYRTLYITLFHQCHYYPYMSQICLK